MISDEERREVVKRLRNGGIARNSNEAYVLLLTLIGIRPQFPAASTYEDAMARIADLIDRQTCFDTESKDSTSFTCSVCGFSESKLTVDPFTLSFRSFKPSYRYCPNCGARVVKTGD